MSDRTIHKVVLQITDTQYHMLPQGAEILSVAEQRDAICVWYLFSPTVPQPTERHRFDIYGTGNPVPGRLTDLGRFLGTVLTHDQQLVWHVVHRGVV